MEYIQPNTDIAFCSGVPIDNTYEHTLTFTNATAQRTYFNSKRTKLISANSYQRVMSNKLRVEMTISEASACNYMYFRNKNANNDTTFENKYFYAFITGWEYVNNITTEITYEIDVFQTYYFDFHIYPCFVVREHHNTDAIGENLVPENLELGDYVINQTGTIAPYDIENVVDADAGCVLLYTVCSNDENSSDYSGGFYNFVFSALNIIKCTTLAQLKTTLNRFIYNRKTIADAVVYACMCPFIPLQNLENNNDMIQNINWSFTYSKSLFPVTLDGYSPKNNKLLTAPFYTLRVRNDTTVCEYPMEYFSGAYIKFQMVGTLIPEPVLTLIPKDFKKGYDLAQGELQRLDLRMSTSSFPQVALASSVYQVYLAQNAASIRTAMLDTGVSGVNNILGSLFSGNLFGASGAFIDAQMTVQKELAKQKDLSVRPQELNGTQSVLSDYAIGAKKFYMDLLTLKYQNAKRIDDYFSMYGYATNEVKTPNILGRPYWNYVKCYNMELGIGNAPQPYIDKIKKCFANGITFWHDPTAVGNYTLNNRPTP